MNTGDMEGNLDLAEKKKLVLELRNLSSLRLLECRQLLEENDYDVAKALAAAKDKYRFEYNR